MKYVLITGVSSGIGKATSNIYIENGYKVIGIDVKNCIENEKLTFFACDITKEDELKNVTGYLKDNNIILDLIINVAGIHKMVSFVESDYKEMKKVIDVNLIGTMCVNKTFYPYLSKVGKIIITTSEVASFPPLPYNGLYSVSKIALDAYAQGLRQELNLLGQKVITIRPGAVETNLSSGSIDDTNKLVNDTILYKKQSVHFAKLVNKFTGKKIKPEKLAKLVYKVSLKKKPKLVYKINTNIGMLLLGILPIRLQCYIIKLLLNRK